MPYSFPDVMRGYNIADEDSGNCVIQNLRRNSKNIARVESSVKITAPTCDIIDSDQVEVNASTVNVNAGNVNLGQGGLPIARVGDAVQVNIATGTGVITAGGVNTSS